MPMRPDTQEGIQVDARPEPQAYDLTGGLACGLACARSDVRGDTLPAAREGARCSVQATLQGCFCEKGLSALQINVLALAYRAGTRVTPYSRISRQLAEDYGMRHHPESVRGAVNRLARRDFLRHQQARDGTIRGVRFTLFEERLCPHIMRPRDGERFAARPDARGDVRDGARPEYSTAPSILKEIDRKNFLSISSEETAEQKALRLLEALTEDDMAYHWPNLAKVGFGTYQIRQIIERLTQANLSMKNVIQGLTHAEWELAAGSMRAKTGQQVSKPVDWVFISLSKTGYYRRPEGYVSPQEQAELDAAEEAGRVTRVCEERKKAAFDVWILELPPKERTAIITPANGGIRMPEDTALRLHFTAYIWPKILESRNNKRGDDEIYLLCDCAEEMGKSKSAIHRLKSNMEGQE